MLEMRGITKSFVGNVVLHEVDLRCHAGEVHALVGENGAGKSTLMKVLVGAHRADAGEIRLEGRPIELGHPREAQERGIGIVYQEFNLLPHRTVAQNVLLGREPGRLGMLDHRALNATVANLLEDLGMRDYFDPEDVVRDLSVAQQQMVEIAKALSYDARVLVMDEPTASLAPREAELLFELIESLRERGIAIVYISHRFDEIFRLAQRITVLRDGRRVGTVARDEASTDDLIRMMVGREVGSAYPERAAREDLGEVKVSVRGAGNAHVSDIDLELRAGEIVGLAGLQGSGRSEVAEALFGVEPFTWGRVEVKGRPVQIRSPRQAVGLGMGFVTEDRKGEGFAPNQSIRDNILLAARSLRPLLSRSGGKGRGPSVAELAEQVDVRATSLDQEVQYLSGGNQQKVVLTKWLGIGADVLILDEPTRGIDVNAKAAIHHLVRRLARSGVAVLMISSELLEVIGMSDRILVMREGRLAGELPAGASEEDIMRLATRDVSPQPMERVGRHA